MTTQNRVSLFNAPRRWSTSVLVLAAAAGTGVPAMAQCPAVWELSAAGGPPIRQNHAAAYDPVRQAVVMFGGFRGGFGSYDDTWEWKNHAWSQINATGPSARSVHSMAYDTARGRLVLFGGNAGGPLGDTWEFNSTTSTWTQVFPAVSPPGRYNHAMAYDSVRGKVVMTGGFSTLRHSDTWEYDGTTWVERLGTSFGARSSHGMAFDISRNTMVIFGGFNGTRLADTKEFNATTGNWTTVVAPGPAGRQYVGLTYDKDQNLVVLFGGQTGPGTLETDRQQDTWVYNGAAWTQVGTDGPSRRDQHTLTYHAGDRELVVYGGYQGGSFGGVAGDTWVTSCRVPTCYANCDGSTIAPILNVSDFICFQQKYAAGDPYANCDNSTIPPILNVSDFICFQQQYAAGCP